MMYSLPLCSCNSLPDRVFSCFCKAHAFGNLVSMLYKLLSCLDVSVISHCH